MLLQNHYIIIIYHLATTVVLYESDILIIVKCNNYVYDIYSF